MQLLRSLDSKYLSQEKSNFLLIFQILNQLSRYNLLQCLDLDLSIFTLYPSESCVHVVSMGDINFKSK